jgi:hypothetical protein
MIKEKKDVQRFCELEPCVTEPKSRYKDSRSRALCQVNEQKKLQRFEEKTPFVT